MLVHLCSTKTQTLFGLFTVKPLSPTELYSKLNPLLHIIQSAAILEILHAIFKIVPSAWFTTLVQVASRLLVLWGYTSTTSFSHWSLYLLAASWSLVEVPRYLFYVWGLVTNNAPAPFPLFWLRYSLFAVLYPTGITGEILQIWNAIPYFKVVAPWARTLSYIILFGLYPPGGPFMYFHMVAMRKLQFKKRAEANKPASAAPQGLVFPTNPATGEISTTDTGRSAFAAATAAIDKAEGDKVLQERNWRFKYAPHVVKQVQLIAANPQAAIASSKAGLDFCYKNFQFVRGSYTGSLEAALKHFKTNRFFEASIKGTAPKPAEYELKVPYAGKTLTGDALKAQLAKWASYGTIEPSCRDAISWAASAKDKLDLSNQYFVLLGAGAAMGPLLVLLEHGANIIAIDLDRPQIWERLLTLAQKSTGKMYFPIKVDPKTLPANPSIQDYAKVAGCNLFTDTPEIATFVSDILPGKTLTIGGYAYLDSAAHVQVSLAMDAIMSEAGARRNTPVNLAFLCSPTDVFTVEKACYDAAKINHIKAPLWQKIIEKIMPKRLKKNCVAGKGPGGVDTFVNDGIVVDQGPNYALAKRIQHWRAMVSVTIQLVVLLSIFPFFLASAASVLFVIVAILDLFSP